MAKSTIETAEHKIEEFADDLGKMLGHARTKAEGWLGQRKTIVKNLTELRDEATKLLTQLGHNVVAEVPFPRSKRGRPVGTKNVIRTRKRRTMSAKARKAIGDAQRKRWAKQKAAAK